MEDVVLRAGLVDELRALLPDGVSESQGALRFLLARLEGRPLDW